MNVIVLSALISIAGLSIWLALWLVAPETNAVLLGLTWPVESFPTNGLLDIFCSTQLTEDVWRRVAQIDVNSSVSNVLAEIAFDTDDA